MIGGENVHKQKKARKQFKMSKGMQNNIQTAKKFFGAYGFPIAAVLIIGYMLIMVVSQSITIYTANSEHEEVLKRIEEEKAVQQRLQEECEQLQDRQHIEQIAREELGLVKEGEIPFISRYKKTN